MKDQNGVIEAVCRMINNQEAGGVSFWFLLIFFNVPNDPQVVIIIALFLLPISQTIICCISFCVFKLLWHLHLELSVLLCISLMTGQNKIWGGGGSARTLGQCRKKTRNKKHQGAGLHSHVHKMQICSTKAL